MERDEDAYNKVMAEYTTQFSLLKTHRTILKSVKTFLVSFGGVLVFWVFLNISSHGTSSFFLLSNWIVLFLSMGMARI